MASTIGQAAAAVRAIGTGLPDVAAKATTQACRYGKAVLLEEARDVWGGDRRPSRWRKGRKTVGARYRITRHGPNVTGVLVPTGDPFYVWVHGRAAGAFPTRQTGTVKHYPAMAARPAVWTRPRDLIVRRTPELYAAATTRHVAQSLRAG